MSGNNTLSCGPFSPSNVGSIVPEIDQSIGDKFKMKVKSTSRDRILTIKSEPPWDMEPVNSYEKRSDADFSIDMNAKTILELCK